MSPKPKSESPPSLAAWQARSLHTITCPSGQRLRIRLPGVGTLLEHGDLSEELLRIAFLELESENGASVELARRLQEASNGDTAEALESIRRYGAFQRELVRIAVEEIEIEGEWQPISLTREDLYSGLLPENDLALVAQIVQRIRDRDAKGVKIGVEPLDRWATFREAHGCPDENCQGCETLIERLSSLDVGEV